MTTVANRKTASWVSTYNVQTPSALSVLSCCSATGCEGYSYDIASGCAVAPERGTEGEFKGNTLAWGTTTFLMGTAGAVTSGIFLYSGGASNQVSAYRLKASMVTGMNMMAWGIADMVGAFYGKEPTIVNLLPSTPKTQEEANVEAAKILFGP